MASILIMGFVRSIRYLPDSVLVFVDEYKRGFKKGDGTRIEEKYISWKVIYKGYFKTYVSKHFGDGMLVEVKGDVLPYAIDHGEIKDGYSVIGQTLNLASYPRNGLKSEKKMLKDSELHSIGTPNVEEYNESDF